MKLKLEEHKAFKVDEGMPTEHIIPVHWTVSMGALVMPFKTKPGKKEFIEHLVNYLEKEGVLK